MTLLLIAAWAFGMICGLVVAEWADEFDKRHKRGRFYEEKKL